MTLGISGVILSILYWNDEHSYDAWNPNKNTAYQLFFDMGDDDIWSSTTAPSGPMAKEKISEIETYSFFDGWYVEELIEFEDKKVLVEKTIQADSVFFQIFPFEFILGNRKTALKDKNSIVLSEEIANQLFEDKDPIGKQVSYDNGTFTVKGVFKRNPKSSINPMIVENSIHERLEENHDNWNFYNFYLFFKLKEGSDISKVKKQLQDISEAEIELRYAKEGGISLEEYRDKYGINLPIIQPLSELRLHTVGEPLPEGKGNYQLLVITLGLSILILILSIVNYINLATANAIKRSKETGIRKIVGASKGQIVLQFVFETAIFLFIAILLSLSLVEIILPYFNNFIQRDLELSIGDFAFEIVIIFGVTLLLSGILPAWYVANFETLKVLKGNFDRSKNGIWIRNSMLVLQFAIASLFIIGSYIVNQQVGYMTTKDLGFNPAQTLMIDYSRKSYQSNYYERYQILKNDLKRFPGILDVSATSFKIGDGSHSSTSSESNMVKKAVQLEIMSSDVNFFDMMDIKILHGRNLSDQLATDTISSVMINKTAAMEYGFINPIGQKITVWGKTFDIVGVIDDINVKGFSNRITPMIFPHYKLLPWMERNIETVYVKINPENTEAILSELERYWNQNVSSEYPFQYEFVDKAFARTYKDYLTQRQIFSILNIIVIIIALFGLFALASYSMERRMKEIAIRKTLGASVETLLKNLTIQYVVFCIIGFAIAIVPTYILLQKWLENFAYRIDISWIPFAVGFVVLLFLTLLIVLSKAYQATKVDVLKYLKYE